MILQTWYPWLRSRLDLMTLQSIREIASTIQQDDTLQNSYDCYSQESLRIFYNILSLIEAHHQSHASGEACATQLRNFAVRSP
jgi:hypothetical protein